MTTVRRTVLALTVMLVAVVTGSGTALAHPKPLIQPEQAPAGGSSSGSSSGFWEVWPQVTLAVLVAVAIVAVALLALTRMRHHDHAASTA